MAGTLINELPYIHYPIIKNAFQIRKKYLNQLNRFPGKYIYLSVRCWSHWNSKLTGPPYCFALYGTNDLGCGVFKYRSSHEKYVSWIKASQNDYWYIRLLCISRWHDQHGLPYAIRHASTAWWNAMCFDGPSVVRDWFRQNYIKMNLLNTS